METILFNSNGVLPNERYESVTAPQIPNLQLHVKLNLNVKILSVKHLPIATGRNAGILNFSVAWFFYGCKAKDQNLCQSNSNLQQQKQHRFARVVSHTLTIMTKEAFLLDNPMDFQVSWNKNPKKD